MASKSEIENQNTIHLKLPNVSFEIVDEAASPGLEGIGRLENEGESPDSPFLPFEMEDEVADSESTAEDREQLRNGGRKEVATELRDLYLLLQRLPPTSIPISSSATVSNSRARGGRLDKRSGKGTKKGRRKDSDNYNYDYYQFCENGANLEFEENFEIEDDKARNNLRKRETLKISSINLYESILPPTLFGSFKR